MMRRNAVVALKKLLQHKELGSRVRSVRENLRLWQDQFLCAIKEKKLQLQSLHAIVVGSDMNAQKKFEMQLRKYVTEKNIQDRVHVVNKTPAVAPYPASIDVPSKAQGEYFGKIVIEQGEKKAKTTVEIDVIGTPGLKQSVATYVKKRLTIGKKACERVKERILEHYMSRRNCSGSQGSFSEGRHK